MQLQLTLATVAVCGLALAVPAETKILECEQAKGCTAEDLDTDDVTELDGEGFVHGEDDLGGSSAVRGVKTAAHTSSRSEEAGGTRMFSRRFYHLATTPDPDTWKAIVTEDGRQIFTPTSGAPPVELVDTDGQTTTVGVPEEGCLVVDPDVIIVTKGGPQGFLGAQPGKSECLASASAATTIIAAGQWRDYDDDGFPCNQAFEWNAQANCYVMTCGEEGQRCGAKVARVGDDVETYEGGCSGTDTIKVCRGALFLF